MLSILSILLSMVLFVTYCAMYISHHELPVSLSETFYHVQHRWKFSVFIIVIAALVFVPWMEATERLEFIVFFACFSVFLVAASPKFKEDFVSQIHYGAAGVMFISTVVWEIFNGGLYWVLGGFAVLAIINRKRWVLWLEIGLFIELHLTLLIREAEKVIVNLCS